MSHPSNGAAAVEPTGPDTDASETETGEGLSDAEVEQSVAALLFASPEPLSLKRMAALVGVAEGRVAAALEGLTRRLAAAELPVRLHEIAGGWQLLTDPAFSEVVSRLAKVRTDEKVSPAALETLAVIAYRQPVTKAEVEAIRGVQVAPVIRALVDRGLVRVVGRSEDPGHALLYGTTQRFLASFALARLEDLPRDSELVAD